MTQVARFRLSQALPSCYARSLASDLGKSRSVPVIFRAHLVASSECLRKIFSHFLKVLVFLKFLARRLVTVVVVHCPDARGKIILAKSFVCAQVKLV